jgi:ribulose kinase
MRKTTRKQNKKPERQKREYSKKVRNFVQMNEEHNSNNNNTKSNRKRK